MPRWIRHAAAWLLAAGLTAAGQAGSTAPSQSPELFDRYAQSGDTGPLTFRDAGEFVALLRSAGRNWIAAAPPAERERRRDLVAVLALETARSAPRHLGYFDGLVIIEWACDLLRKDAQTEFERQWMLASSSLLLRSYYEYHYGYGPEGYRGGPSAIRHLEHALGRFPGEPRLRLAKILLRPEAYALSSRPGADPDDLVKVPLPSRRGGPPGLTRIAQTIEALGELVDESDVGAEARTHLAWLQFHLGDVPGSRETFTRAARAATDPFVRNLAWLGVGLSLDAEGRRTDATNAYRAAVEAMPRARASAVQLAAHVFLAGERRNSLIRPMVPTRWISSRGGMSSPSIACSLTICGDFGRRWLCRTVQTDLDMRARCRRVRAHPHRSLRARRPRTVPPASAQAPFGHAPTPSC